jgi:DNA-binding transcriptional ArsR family regulator
MLAVANAKSLLTVLAEPTRLVLVDALRAGPLSVGELARRVPVTRSAVSQHLKVLKDAGIVDDRAQGTTRLYHLQAETLGEVRAYIDKLWDDALGTFAEDIARKQGVARRRKRT